VLFPLTAQFFIPVLIPCCTEVSLSLDYGSQAYIVSQKGKIITPDQHNSYHHKNISQQHLPMTELQGAKISSIAEWFRLIQVLEVWILETVLFPL
jgi:hypothetical protein